MVNRQLDRIEELSAVNVPLLLTQALSLDAPPAKDGDPIDLVSVLRSIERVRPT